jgi:hypothetical protein
MQNGRAGLNHARDRALQIAATTLHISFKITKMQPET